RFSSCRGPLESNSLDLRFHRRYSRPAFTHICHAGAAASGLESARRGMSAAHGRRSSRRGRRPMLFHTTKWGWKRLAAGLCVAPVARAGLPDGLTAPRVKAAPLQPQAVAPMGAPKALLRDAKAALEAGDYNRAQDLTQQAEASNTSGKWGLFEDNPAS